MDKLEHDPKTKQQIKDALCSYLYEPVERQFRARLETLIMRNTLMGGYSHKHFVYKGQLYISDTSPAPTKKNRLLAALRGEMDDYLTELEELNQKELPYVLGFINQVLNSSSDLTDYLRVLPESIHHPLTNLMATCPCRTTSLSDERVETLMSKNQASIDMIKRRLVTNLLI